MSVLVLPHASLDDGRHEKDRRRFTRPWLAVTKLDCKVGEATGSKKLKSVASGLVVVEARLKSLDGERQRIHLDRMAGAARGTCLQHVVAELWVGSFMRHTPCPEQHARYGVERDAGAGEATTRSSGAEDVPQITLRLAKKSRAAEGRPQGRTSS